MARISTKPNPTVQKLRASLQTKAGSYAEFNKFSSVSTKGSKQATTTE